MKPHFAISGAHSLFWLLFLACFSLKAVSVSSTSSSFRDTQQLLNFKASLPNSKPVELQNWLPNQNPCTFRGVVCDSTLVSAIDLSFVNLRTNLSLVFSFLLGLDHLETLTLKAVNLSGSISSGSSSKCGALLTNLDLSLNSLSGPISDISNLGSCPSLKSLPPFFFHRIPALAPFHL